MNKTALTIFYGVLAVLRSACATADTEVLPAEIRVEADSIECYYERPKFSAQGNVRVTHPEISLTADAVIGDALTGDLDVTGNVSFRRGQDVLTGNRFTYNLNKHEGLARDASGKVEEVFLHGEEIRAQPDKYTVSRSRFTTCDALKPHYYLSARELEIQPGQKLLARDVSIVFFGTRILSVPKYSVKLRDRKKKPLGLPSIGIGGPYGVHAGYNFDLSHEPATIGNLDLRLSTRQLLQGGFSYRKLAGVPIFAYMTYRQPYYGGGRADLMLSRLPELGYRFYSDGAEALAIEADETKDFLNRILDPTGLDRDYRGLDFIGQMSIGKFVEEPNHTKSGRLDARAVTWLTPTLIDSRTSISPGISVRYSSYESGADYADIGFRLAAGRKLGEDTYLSATYVTHAVHGTTPFQFDTVEVPHELAAKIRFHVGSLTLEFLSRYDLGNHTLFDSEISVAKVMHCIEPKLTWRNRFNEIGLDVALVGF